MVPNVGLAISDGARDSANLPGDAQRPAAGNAEGTRRGRGGDAEEVEELRNGQGGIRTHGTLLTYTHFPGVRLKPLGHLSKYYNR